VTIDVTPVNDPPVVAVSLTTQTVQYSDGITPVTITAKDVDSVLTTGSLTSAGIPLALLVSGGTCAVVGAGSECSWTLSGFVTVGAGTYSITFTVDDLAAEFNTGSTSTEVVVIQEDATAMLDENNVVAVIVDAPGSGLSQPFSLTVFVEETEPDVATSGSPAAGDISNAAVTMGLVPVGPGSSVGPSSCDVPLVTGGTGYDATLEVTCHFSGVPVNTYSAIVIVDGDFYTGSAEDVLTVYDPSLGFTTGGGWFYWPETEDKTNFSFTIKYSKKGNSAKGSLLIIRHLADGSIFRLKSNALEGLAVGESDDPLFGWASANGKATYREPGWPDPVGNYRFIVYVEDHGEPGRGADRLWLKVHDKDDDVVSAMSIDPPPTANAVVINGGNIVVPHGKGGGKGKNP
jgi:hypothetical protein